MLTRRRPCHWAVAHLGRLEHVARGRFEKRVVELEGQVVVAHVDGDVLCAAQPAWQRVHVSAGKAQAEREGPQQHLASKFLDPSDRVGRIVRESHRCAALHRGGNLDAFDLIPLHRAESKLLEKPVLVDRGD
jgi:hypothetical protein